MFAMSIPLAVRLLDRVGRVLEAPASIKPWRFGPIVRGGKSVVELPAGTAARTRTTAGDMVIVEEHATGSVDYGAV